jgi:16S rRNA (cytosine967-C5)-methyltransferase
MSRSHSYLHSARIITGQYKGEEPFAAFLKKYFAANKKFGSRDRKLVAHSCYCYFRTIHIFPEDTAEERLLKGLFLCANESNEILEAIKPEWNKKVHLHPLEKISTLNILRKNPREKYSLLSLFPWKDELSEGVDHVKLSQSFLVQPDLFLRLRPGYERVVKEKLQNAGIEFKELQYHCLALPNSSKVDTIIEPDKEAVIQDYSSQRIGEFLQLVKRKPESRPIKVWDCCAASGGKSILARDILGNIELTVSDVRERILINLKKRLKEAGILKYQSFVADLSPNTSEVFNLKPDIIIADVPCTGSGTWARTPEQLAFFDWQAIERYCHLQRKIISNTIPLLSPGGYYLYITCSVFRKENEENTAFIKEQFRLEPVKTGILNGYDRKADSMFAALFRKRL